MTSPAPSPVAPARDAAWQFALLAAPYWNSRRRWKVRSGTLLLLALTIGQVSLVIWTSYWNRRFFDALEARSLHELLSQVAVFALILALTPSGPMPRCWPSASAVTRTPSMIAGWPFGGLASRVLRRPYPKYEGSQPRATHSRRDHAGAVSVL